jgi:NitT/TauT family transport system substrate-binding protein
MEAHQLNRSYQSDRLINLIVILFLVLILSADTILAKSVSNNTVRLAYLQNDIHQLAYWIASEKGYFADQDVHINIAGVFRAGPEIMSAFAAGELDMAYVGEAPATIAAANQTAKVVAVAQVNAEGSALVVSKDSLDIISLKDLRGKTVAVPGYGTVQDFLLRRVLSQNKMDYNSLNIIILKPPEMIGALQTNQIQAFLAWEPYPSKAVTMGVGRRLATSHEMWEGHPCCILAASSDFISKHPETVKAFVQAHIRATEFIHHHIQEAIQIAMKYTGMDEATIREAINNVSYVTALDISGEAEYVQFLNRFHYVQIKDETAFIRSFLDTNYIKEK